MAGVAGLNSTNEINGCDAKTASKDPVETAVTPNDCRTFQSLETLRNRVGPNTRKGHLLSNLIKQALWQDEPESNRSWATHPTQNLPWIMSVQRKALAKGER
jgi:hypothetical protein